VSLLGSPAGRSAEGRLRAAGVGAVFGVAVAVVGLFAGGILSLENAGELLSDPLVGPLFAYAVVGWAVLGATLSVQYARDRTLAPLLLVGGAFGYAGYRSWVLFQSPATPLPGTPVAVAGVAARARRGAGGRRCRAPAARRRRIGRRRPGLALLAAAEDAPDTGNDARQPRHPAELEQPDL
jgi:hypothetical protein